MKAHSGAIIFLMFILTATAVQGQNLILNSRFTDFDTSCTWHSGTSFEVADAFTSINCQPVWGEFSSCGTRANPSLARKGNMFASLIVYDHYVENSRTYLQGQLCRPLQKAGIYEFSMYIRLKDDARFTTSSFGVAISHNPFPIRGSRILLNIKPSIQNNKKVLLDKKDGWMLFSGTYIARGGETYITIGNFETDNRSRRKRVGKRKDNVVTEIFIDDLRLFSANDTLDCTYLREVVPEPKIIVEEPEKEPEIEAPFVVNRFYILEGLKFSSPTRLQGKYPQLDSLAAFLKENIKYDVEIRGHTDNTLGREAGYESSLTKALAVKYYLMQAGIGSQRIRTNGYGFSVPITSNETAEGRSRNNRVDIQIIPYK